MRVCSVVPAGEVGGRPTRNRCRAHREALNTSIWRRCQVDLAIQGIGARVADLATLPDRR